MEKTFGQKLIESLEQAVAHAQGNQTGTRTHVVDVVDVKALRKQLRMTQIEFGNAYRIPLATLKGWEQGRRVPDAPALALLTVIARYPSEARAALT